MRAWRAVGYKKRGRVETAPPMMGVARSRRSILVLTRPAQNVVFVPTSLCLVALDRNVAIASVAASAKGDRHRTHRPRRVAVMDMDPGHVITALITAGGSIVASGVGAYIRKRRRRRGVAVVVNVDEQATPEAAKRQRSCSECGEPGHNAQTCPKVRRCKVCGRRGHNARSCPSVRRCSHCHSAEHDARTCPEVRRCSVCNGAGHDARTCPLEATQAAPKRR
jgi:hypothetical protein